VAILSGSRRVHQHHQHPQTSNMNIVSSNSISPVDDDVAMITSSLNDDSNLMGRENFSYQDEPAKFESLESILKQQQKLNKPPATTTQVNQLGSYAEEMAKNDSYTSSILISARKSLNELKSTNKASKSLHVMGDVYEEKGADVFSKNDFEKLSKHDNDKNDEDNSDHEEESDAMTSKLFF
jgi:hypothetical protein